MLPDRRRIGAHLPQAHGLVKAADRAAEIGAAALQIFGDNPTAWKRRNEPSAEQAAFRERIAAHGIDPVSIHAAYLVNLAGPDPAFFAKSVDVLATELRAAPGFGARLVNVHTGSHRQAGSRAGIERLADGVAAVLAEVPPGPNAATLLLENSAGGGFAVGATVEDLAAIADAVGRRGIADERVGFCLDTAHLWSAGYRISEPDEVDAVLESFDRLIGLERLRLIHLNDSKSESGSRLDRHQHVGAGTIGEIGMGHILRHPRLGDVPYVVETPGMDEGYDAVNVARARALARGESVEPLPPEALHLRGGRAGMPSEPEPV